MLIDLRPSKIHGVADLQQRCDLAQGCRSHSWGERNTSPLCLADCAQVRLLIAIHLAPKVAASSVVNIAANHKSAQQNAMCLRS